MVEPIRRMLWAAVAFPVLYFAALVAGGAVNPGYDHLIQQPSELGADGTPHPAVFNTLIFCAGVAAIMAAFAFRQSFVFLGARRRLAVIIGILGAVAGTYLIGVAVFPLPDPRHYAISPMALAPHPVPFLMAAALWNRPDWRGMRTFLIVVGLVMLAILGVVLFAQPIVRPIAGLWTRMYALASMPWLAVVGLALRSRLATNAD